MVDVIVPVFVVNRVRGVTLAITGAGVRVLRFAVVLLRVVHVLSDRASGPRFWVGMARVFKVYFSSSEL